MFINLIHFVAHNISVVIKTELDYIGVRNSSCWQISISLSSVITLWSLTPSGYDREYTYFSFSQVPESLLSFTEDKEKNE